MGTQDYVILRSVDDHTALANGVNKLIQDGFTPSGGLVVIQTTEGVVYIQAMVSKRGAQQRRAVGA